MTPESAADEQLDFAGKVALVSGGSRGIGFACARLLAERGASVVFCATDEGNVTAAERRLQDLAGGPVAGFVCDVADRARVEALLYETMSLHGRLDICVANAGTGSEGAFDVVDQERVDRLVAVNLAGVRHVVTGAARIMGARGGGAIVAIGSTSGIVAERSAAVYSATKAGVHLLCSELAWEVGRAGVRVNSVAPGWVDTDMAAHVRENPEELDLALRCCPLGRLAQPREIAEVVAFLAGDEASAITGAVVCADGGTTSLYQVVSRP